MQRDARKLSEKFWSWSRNQNENGLSTVNLGGSAGIGIKIKSVFFNETCDVCK